MTLLLMLAACAKYPEPEGPPPDFEPGAEFISADTVAAELAAGAGFYFLDARPPADYALEHITGAISTPFYEIADHANQIEPGHWIITYCSCPHSESGIVAEYMREQGHEDVAVLDEGFLYWRDQGYPTQTGD
jgi:cytochrome c oxidase cbb3-type subunit 3/ubiquinol-cytochrome c reductase cytochrome c subunit